MKKIFFICVLALSSLTMRASVADLFTVDKAVISSEMTDLNTLESFVQMNEGVTLSDVQVASNVLAANVISVEESPFSQASMLRGGSDGPVGIPSFLWGFCFGPVGMLVVYVLTEQDRDETMKSFYGCLISTAISVALQVVWLGAL